MANLQIGKSPCLRVKTMSVWQFRREARQSQFFVYCR